MRHKILLWGTGGIAKQFIENGHGGEIVGFIETKKSKKSFMDQVVYQSNDLPSAEQYDYIIVANKSVDAVYKVCQEKGINLAKCIFLFPVKMACGSTNREEIRDILGEKNYTNYCAELGEYQGTFLSRIWKHIRTLIKEKILIYSKNIFGRSFPINTQMQGRSKTISGKICGRRN